MMLFLKKDKIHKRLGLAFFAVSLFVIAFPAKAEENVRAAIIEKGVVTNTIILPADWNPHKKGAWQAPQGAEVIFSDTAGIGDTYESGQFIRPPREDGVFRVPESPFAQISDSAYKENIVDISYGLEEFMNLKPRSYTMRNSGISEIGFIAQEVENIIPELVEGEEGEKVLRYGNLTAVAVKAIQELSQKLDDAISGGTISTALGSTNAWSVDQQSGRVNVVFFGDVNLQGNSVLDLKKITGYLGKWSIDEGGNITAQTISVEKGEFKKGIILYDEETGKPLCVRARSSVLVSVPGTCEDAPEAETFVPESPLSPASVPPLATSTDGVP